MSGLKLLALAIAFIATGGILFTDYFRTNKWVKGAAAGMAGLASIYLLLDLRKDFFAKPAPLETGSVDVTPPAPPAVPPETVVVVPLAERIKTRHVTFSTDGAQLYIVTGGPILVWDRKFNVLRKTKSAVSMARTALSADGQILAEASYGNAVNLMNLRAGTVTALKLPELPSAETLKKIAIANNGTYLAAASYVMESGPKDANGKSEPVFKPHLRVFNLLTKKQT